METAVARSQKEHRVAVTEDMMSTCAKEENKDNRVGRRRLIGCCLQLQREGSGGM